MTLKTSSIPYKALRYPSNAKEFKLVDDEINLEKIGKDEYNVASSNILIEVKYAALNPIDFLLFNSKIPLLSRMNGFGKDYSGVVIAIGSEAAKKSDLKVGDKVCGSLASTGKQGTLSEYLLLDVNKPKEAENLITIPKNLSMSQASAWPLVFGTAYNLLKLASRSDKGKLLIIGGGTSVGRLIVQMAKPEFGYKEVVVISSASSGERAKSFGADKYIDYTRYGSIAQPVLDEASKGKFDAVIDCCGNKDLLDNLSEILRQGKTKPQYISICGSLKANFETTSLIALLLSLPFLKLILSFFGLLSYVYKFYLLSPGKDWMLAGKRLFEEEKIQIDIDHVYTFDSIYDATKRVAGGRANGKVVVEIS